MCIYIKFRRQLLLFHLCDKKDDINKKKKIPKLSFKRNRKRIKINDTSDTKIPPPPIQRIRKFRSETRTSAPPPPLLLQATKGNPWTDLYLESYRGRLKAKGAESSSRLTAKPSPLSLLFKDRDSH